MKKIILSASLIFIGLSSFVLKPHNEGDLKINSELSTIEWIGKKVTGQHNGTILLKEGKLHVHDGVVESGTIIINMESITCADLEGEWSDKLVGHLNSADFFDVKNHKTSTLKIKSTTKTKGNEYKVKGDLTIKGITKPIEFPANIEIKDGKLASFSEIKVDRTLYDIKYGSGKFFEGLGDKMIDDNFIIKFKIAAE